MLVSVQPIDSPGSPQDAHRITPWKMNCQDHPEYSPDGKLILFRRLPKGEEGPQTSTGYAPTAQACTHSPTHLPLSSTLALASHRASIKERAG